MLRYKLLFLVVMLADLGMAYCYWTGYFAQKGWVVCILYALAMVLFTFIAAALAIFQPRYYRGRFEVGADLRATCVLCELPIYGSHCTSIDEGPVHDWCHVHKLETDERTLYSDLVDQIPSAGVRHGHLYK